EAAKLEQISRLPGTELAKLHPIDAAKVDAKLADVGAIEAHVDSELTRIQPHLLESDPFVRGGGFVNPTRTDFEMDVPGKGKPMNLVSPSIIVLEPMPGNLINGVEVTAQLAEAKGNPVATGTLVQADPGAGPRWEVPRPGSPHPSVTVETSGGKHAFVDPN